MTITKELFGTLTNGQDITAYLLDNGNGVSARILNYGGIVRNLYNKLSFQSGDDCGNRNHGRWLRPEKSKLHIGVTARF